MLFYIICCTLHLVGLILILCYVTPLIIYYYTDHAAPAIRKPILNLDIHRLSSTPVDVWSSVYSQSTSSDKFMVTARPTNSNAKRKLFVLFSFSVSSHLVISAHVLYLPIHSIDMLFLLHFKFVKNN